MNLFTKFLLGGLLGLLIAGMLGTFANLPNDALLIMLNIVGGVFTFVGLIGTCVNYADRR